MDVPDVEEVLAGRPGAPIFAAGSDPAAVAQALREEGFAVLRGALPPESAAELRSAVEAEARRLLAEDPQRLGNRGPRRYSWGGASTTHHMVHVREWAQLLDLPSLTPVLEAAFSGDYIAVGGGGDFVLGETDTHQRLHVDLQLPEMYDKENPPAAIVANFAVDDVSCEDGPLRLVPRTQHRSLEASQLKKDWGYATHLQKEALLLGSWNLSSLPVCPLTAGDAVLRDMRLWHGGTPNRRNRSRYLPSAEFLSTWYASITIQVPEDHFSPRPALPFEHWLGLSANAQKRAQFILAAPEPVQAKVREDFVLMLPYVAEERP
ncbi:OLA1 [Symbiodinium microadriaticum]|nr:OLA1 [Symbiodinium microadriaticum]